MLTTTPNILLAAALTVAVIITTACGQTPSDRDPFPSPRPPTLAPEPTVTPTALPTRTPPSVITPTPTDTATQLQVSSTTPLPTLTPTTSHTTLAEPTPTPQPTPTPTLTIDQKLQKAIEELANLETAPPPPTDFPIPPSHAAEQPGGQSPPTAEEITQFAQATNEFS